MIWWWWCLHWLPEPGLSTCPCYWLILKWPVLFNRLHSLAPFSPSCQGSCLATSKIDSCVLHLPRSVLITEPWTARARGQVVTRVEESCQSWLLVSVALSALVSFKALNFNLSKVDNVGHSFRYLLGIVFFIPNMPCTRCLVKCRSFQRIFDKCQRLTYS